MRNLGALQVAYQCVFQEHTPPPGFANGPKAPIVRPTDGHITPLTNESNGSGGFICVAMATNENIKGRRLFVTSALI
jgi:hypothetical protein